MDPMDPMVQHVQVHLAYNSSGCVSYRPSVLFTRKLFTLVITLNAVGIVFAASGHFQYAEKWTTAMALGNLNCAILMRNELFGRFLYLFVNTCFAKVTIPVLYRGSGYGTYRSSVDTLMVETWLYVYPSGTLIDFQAA